MPASPETVRRWIRLQRELGLDEVFLDEPWAPPATSPSLPPERPEPRRSAPAPQGAPTRPDRAPAPPAAPPRPERGAVPGAPARPEPMPPLVRPSSAPQPPRAPAAPPPTPRPAPVRAPAVPAFAALPELHAHARACTRCILHGKRRAQVLEGATASSTWAVLTLYGWADDADRGQLLSGSYAQAFLDLVAASGLPAPVVLPLLACAPSDPADTTIQGFTEAVRCRPYWTQSLKLQGVRAVLVLDHKATQFARGPAAPVAWPAFRGEAWTLEGLPAVSTHHPARLARSAQLGPEVASDLALLKSLLEKA